MSMPYWLMRGPIIILKRPCSKRVAIVRSLPIKSVAQTAAEVPRAISPRPFQPQAPVNLATPSISPRLT